MAKQVTLEAAERVIDACRKKAERSTCQCASPWATAGPT
jgi:hypothetical protein